MTTFGTSAYLKLLALNPKPRDTEIRKRFVVSKRPYDFHKAMRKIVTEYASGGVYWTTTEARLNAMDQRTPNKASWQRRLPSIQPKRDLFREVLTRF